MSKKARYTKEQLLESKRYTAVQKDILRVVLEDGKTYTHEEAQQAISGFLRRRVN